MIKLERHFTLLVIAAMIVAAILLVVVVIYSLSPGPVKETGQPEVNQSALLTPQANATAESKSLPEAALDTPAKPPSPESPPPDMRTKESSFGSAVLLGALWTQGQLKGHPSDLRTRSLAQPDLTPPDRLEPERHLPPVPEDLTQVIRSVKPQDHEKLVALTFDLCERAVHQLGYRYEIIDFLREESIPATFFVGGKWLRSHSERGLQLMADPLFELGNHAWTHGNLGVMKPDQARNQIMWTQSQYELMRQDLTRRAEAAGLAEEMALVPESMRLMRLPYGRCNQANLALMAELGLPVVQWSDLGDAGSAARIVAGIKPGAIILMHANGVPARTHILLPQIVALLREQGYRFVTVSELLESGPAVRVKDGYFSNPGDNLHLDAKFLGQGTLGLAPEQR